jgi:hypothetical protein
MITEANNKQLIHLVVTDFMDYASTFNDHAHRLCIANGQFGSKADI